MVAEVFIAVVAVVIVFEVFEHVIILLIGVHAGRRRQPLTGAEGMVGKVWVPPITILTKMGLTCLALPGRGFRPGTSLEGGPVSLGAAPWQPSFSTQGRDKKTGRKINTFNNTIELA